MKLKHYHDNKDLLDTITEERVTQWDSNSENSFGGDYNYLDNKPLTYLGDDSDIVINFAAESHVDNSIKNQIIPPQTPYNRKK